MKELELWEFGEFLAVAKRMNSDSEDPEDVDYDENPGGVDGIWPS